MKDAHFYIYNVGHGVCTLLTGKKGDGSPYCGVFDCGSKAAHGLCGLDPVIMDMKKKILAQKATEIDDVVISHQDYDHWEMILKLIYGLNNIGTGPNDNYTDVFVGSFSHAWMHTNHTNGTVREALLYSISDKNSYDLQGFSCWYSYSAHLRHKKGELKSFSVYAYPTNIQDGGWSSAIEFTGILKNTYKFKLIVSGEKFNKNTYEFSIPWEGGFSIGFAELMKKIKIYIKDHKKKYNLDFKKIGPLRSALNSMKDKFAEDTWDYLAKGIENCASITFPVKRFVLGGDLITAEYALLKTILLYMHYNYMSVKSYYEWMRYGAYMAIYEYNISAKFERRFPFYESDEIVRNATSVIAEFRIKENDIILLPGDVTVHGFNELIENIPSENVNLFLAPHHGSDDTNFYSDLLEQLFEGLIKNNGNCNLVISGYNRFNKHPGEQFTKLAVEKFGAGAIEHEVAYAECLTGDGPVTQDELRTTLSFFHDEKSEETKSRVFTTNCLPFSGNDYFDYRDGKITMGTITTTQNSMRCLLRRLPPDNSFI